MSLDLPHALAGSVLTPAGWVAGEVRIEGSRIAGVSGDLLPAGAPPAPPYILPGFIDLHVHGGGGHDWQGGEAGIRGIVRYHAGYGTVAMAPTTSTARVPIIEEALGAIGAVRASRQPGEAIALGAHLEGPFINRDKLGAQEPVALDGDPELARRWAERFPLVVATVAPEIPGGLAVVEALAAAGCRVQIGHSLADPEGAAEGFRHGCRGFTHLFNAMSGVDHRTPGVAAYALAHGRFAEVICDGLHVHPTAILAAYRAIPRLYAITDATFTGVQDGTYDWGQHRIVKVGARVTLDDRRTLAGSAITMLDALRNLVGMGLSLAEASAMTSSRQAEYLDRTDLGRIEPGARACVIRLDATLGLEAVWVDGESIAPATRF